MRYLDANANKQLVDTLFACYERVRTYAKHYPFCLHASANTSVECSVRQGEVESIQSDAGYDISFTLYRGSKRGNVSTNTITDSSLQETVERAIVLANYANEDEHARPVETELLACHFPPLQQGTTQAVALDTLVDAAKSIESAAFAHDTRIVNSEGSSADFSDSHQLFATHDDFCMINADSSLSASVGVIAQAQDTMQSGWYWSHTFDDIDTLDATAIGTRAATDAIAGLGAQIIPTGEYSVLLTPSTAVSLLATFLSALDGHKLYKNITFLQDKLGEVLFPSWFTLLESPFLPKGWGSAHRDADGVGCTQKVIVEDGVLQTYLYDCYSARKLGTQTTGNAGGTTNIELTHSEKTYDELVSDVDSGVVITHLMGDASNLLTGQYSRGAKGFFVKNGVVQFPVEGITLSASFCDMFKNLRACGKDIDLRYKYLTGSWLIDKMIVAS